MVANPDTLAVRLPQPMPSRRRVPPNLFGIAFGLAGLGEAWTAGRQTLGVSRAVPDAIFLLAAVVWVVLITGYAAQGRARVLADLRHPVLAPFVSLAVIIPMILASALATVAFAAGRALVIFFLAATIAVASDALLWIGRERPSGAVLYCVLVLVVITGFIALIAVRTVMTAARGELLPTS